MSDCEQCAVLQRQNDFLANDRDGYVQVLRDEDNRLRAEVERLNKSRNKWGQKYNKLLEKHKVTVSQLKAAVWSDSEECKLLTAENEKLRAALREYVCNCPKNTCEYFPCGEFARAALEGK